jgi:hypothetical protein
MLSRLFVPGDAEAVADLLGPDGITDPRLDHLIVCGPRSKPEGVLVYRPGALVHELECGRSLRRAEALANFAIARAASYHGPLTSAVFLVRGENTAMQRWAESQPGMVKQNDPGDVIYTWTP